MIDEEVTAVVLAVVVVVGVFSVSQTIFAGRIVEPFSELAVLGPGKMIGDYPSTVVTGEPFQLYLYVGNHEGHAMYYRVLVKLSDQASNVSETQPLDAPALAYYETVVQHGGNQTRPITLSLGTAGLNRRLVFELHAYNTELERFTYHGRWCQLWLNVTEPAT